MDAEWAFRQQLPSPRTRRKIDFLIEVLQTSNPQKAQQYKDRLTLPAAEPNLSLDSAVLADHLRLLKSGKARDERAAAWQQSQKFSQ